MLNKGVDVTLKSNECYKTLLNFKRRKMKNSDECLCKSRSWERLPVAKVRHWQEKRKTERKLQLLNLALLNLRESDGQVTAAAKISISKLYRSPISLSLQIYQTAFMTEIEHILGRERKNTYLQENLILPNWGSSNCTVSSNSCPL